MAYLVFVWRLQIAIRSRPAALAARNPQILQKRRWSLSRLGMRGTQIGLS
jgi:hypothetical protein